MRNDKQRKGKSTASKRAHRNVEQKRRDRICGLLNSIKDVLPKEFTRNATTQLDILDSTVEFLQAANIVLNRQPLEGSQQGRRWLDSDTDTTKPTTFWRWDGDDWRVVASPALAAALCAAKAS
eukprot:c13873_g1_i1.p1 GENE.c13873_g1_i1~~c13873_g1_i1.p1  ORF type:complete len:123 (+),score=21.00 c13873_g1_i1:43-411(+)